MNSVLYLRAMRQESKDTKRNRRKGAKITRKSGSSSVAAPIVGIIMGSRSDWATMSKCAEILDLLEVPYEAKVVSAHRTPRLLFNYADSAASRGIAVIIAGAGGAAHLPGMTASITALPVIGVPVESRALKGLDSLLSIAQMPPGIPVASMAIGEAGAKNAALFASAILALSHPKISNNLTKFRVQQTEKVLKDGNPRK